jgi:hypothetical protein
VEISPPLTPNFPLFNTLLLFAPFECTLFFFTRTLARQKALRRQENNSTEEFKRGNEGKSFL